MGSLLLELLPFAIGLAATPGAIATGILFLGSKQALANAIAFAAAFSLVYAGLAAIVLVAAGAADEPLVDDRTKSIVTLAIGLLLLALALLNPNIPILLGGLTTIAAADVSAADEFWGTVFLLAASQLGLAGPILWYVARPASASRSLDRVKDWLARHEKLVDLGLLVVFGALFTLKGLAGL